MKFQTVAYKEVVVTYNDHNMKIIEEIWATAPFKFRQYTDVRNGDLVEVFVMPVTVWDEHIRAVIDQTMEALMNDFA